MYSSVSLSTGLQLQDIQGKVLTVIDIFCTKKIVPKKPKLFPRLFDTMVDKSLFLTKVFLCVKKLRIAFKPKKLVPLN